MHGHFIQPIMCPAISKMPAHLKVIDLHQFLVLLDKLTICPGHPDHHLIFMAKQKEGKFMSQGGDVTAYLDSNAAVELNGQTYGETIRSSNCHLLSVANIKSVLGTEVPYGQCTTNGRNVRNYHRLPARTAIQMKDG